MYHRMIKMPKGNVQSDTSVKNKVIEQFYPELHRYCRFLSKNKWDGDDLTQEAMIKASQFYQPSQISIFGFFHDSCCTFFQK